ncbi:MAG: hypothetical protein ACRERY_06145 [Pseudomonas sp.]
MKNALLFVLVALTTALASSTFILYKKHSEFVGSGAVSGAIEVSPSATTINKRVSGQIFVITRGGTSIPLGGVIITAHPLDIVQQALPAIYKQRAFDITHAAQRFIQLTHETEEKYKILKKARILSNAYKKADKEWLASISYRNNSLWKFVDSTAGKTYFDALPEPSKTLQSDAGGRFELDLPAHTTWVLSACASREIGETTENYCWFVISNLENEILLNNHNMFGTYSSDSLIKMTGMREDCKMHEECIENANQIISLYAPHLL